MHAVAALTVECHAVHEKAVHIGKLYRVHVALAEGDIAQDDAVNVVQHESAVASVDGLRL